MFAGLGKARTQRFSNVSMKLLRVYEHPTASPNPISLFSRKVLIILPRLMIVGDRALRYWYGSQKQHSSFLHTATIYRLLQPIRSVFTARCDANLKT